MRTVKYEILQLNPDDFTNTDNNKKMCFMETIRDLMLYQIHEKKKKKFLTEQEQERLSKLQEEIDDCVGIIFINSDVDLNKTWATVTIQNFLKEL